MDIKPRHVAGLAALALVPVGIYAAFSGEMTTVTTLLSVAGTAIIVGSLLLMFSPVSTEEDAVH